MIGFNRVRRFENKWGDKKRTHLNLFLMSLLSLQSQLDSMRLCDVSRLTSRWQY